MWGGGLNRERSGLSRISAQMGRALLKRGA